jgi:hypothetical protein
MSGAAGVDWRRRFADYQAALAAHQRAQGCVEQLQTRLAACMGEGEIAAIEAGMAVAERRARRASKTLAAATNAFTQGRSVLEAVWDAPDEV